LLSGSTARVRAKDTGTTNTALDRIYQFQSSSSSFDSGVDVDVGSSKEGEVRGDAATTSGSNALPRAVLPASSSSSISDCVDGTDAGARFAVEPGANAEKMDCETSERRTEARFWLFENLATNKPTKERTKGTLAQGTKSAA
jgi:hypothetical protein